MVLRVELPEGQFIVDVGFGRLTLTTPLQLVPNIEQQTTLEVFRLIPVDGQFQVQIKLRDKWAAVYQVSLQEVSHDDYAVYNWFTSTNPDVVFTNHLMVARPTDKLRYGLFDNQLSIHHLNGQTEKRKIHSSSELAAMLKEHFRIRLTLGCGAVLNASPPRMPNNSGAPSRCPLLAQSGHPQLHRTCLLSGVKQT